MATMVMSLARLSLYAHASDIAQLDGVVGVGAVLEGEVATANQVR